MGRLELHAHSHYSNLRLLDCIVRPKDLVDRAIELGLSGVCLTDHECLSGHVEIDKLVQEYKKKYPNFKIGRGNEIYLTDDREPKQKYYHFILVAKDKIGHKMLRELSSNSWINSYFDRGMERVPTLKTELAAIVKKYGKGHLIASTACLGSEIDFYILEMDAAEKENNLEKKKFAYDKIVSYVNFCRDLFEDDFYLEVQPAQSKEQLIVNNRMSAIGKAFNIKLIVTTDAHYLKKEDRTVHDAFLKSKNGERETASFYSYAYLQSTEEVIENLKNTNLDYYELEKNTLEIYDKLEDYSLHRNQSVPQVEVKNYPRVKVKLDYPTLAALYDSEEPQERYWVNYCIDKLKELNLYNETYLSRLEEEARTKKIIGEKLETCMFAYPIFLQHYIDMFWECGSVVGAGRGSAGAGLNHYLLGITQTDPIKTNAPWFRYMNEERTEPADVDIDISPNKREFIFEKIREERGQLGCVQVCTFGTASTKSAILIACRGLDIDNDTALYISSLVPSERGFLWPVHDLIYGNEETGRKKNTTFINTVSQYPNLLDVIVGVEGLIVSRGIHASGVIFYDDDPFETACFMKATNGAVITQFDLHDAEYMGDLKYDYLVTEQCDIMQQCIQLLQENGYIEKELSLRQAYDKYVHPDVLPLEDDKLWDAIDSTNILALFQLNSAVGANVVKQLQPRTVEELVACNALMRLTGEKGKERPADRYARLKNNISQWYAEMDYRGLTQEEQKVMEKYCLADYGAPSSQEVLMLILMDKDTCGFSLADANAARKIVAKKLMNKIPELKNKILTQAASYNLGEYIWDTVIMPQCSYSFSRIHGYSYSLIACQAAYLATYFPSIYWNTAYLRVVSGLEDASEETIVPINAYEKEDMENGADFKDLPDRSGKIKKTSSTNYKKVAQGIGSIIEKGIKVSLVDINKSGYMFEPDEENDTILYSLKALDHVGDEVVEQIIANRPYSGLNDFMEKNNFNKTVMVSLIKSGAFDQFSERSDIMKDYIWSVCEPKKRITMQNFNGLMQREMLPEELDFQKRLFIFNKALKKNCKIGDKLKIENNYYDFYSQFFDIDKLSPSEGTLTISEKEWKKMYDAGMAPAKTWITAHKEELLEQLNNSLFQELWEKYAAGDYSAWEMSALGFYYHDHELKNINRELYNIQSFKDKPEKAEVDYTFHKNGREIPIFKTYRICGTVIAKDDMKHTVSILTPDSGVVNVKFTQNYYAKYNRRLSEQQPDGTKKVVEQGWFVRGRKILVNGFRRDNMFVAKKYKKSNSHQLYLITDIKENGEIEITNKRYGEE